jgi:hypothetical protein
MFVMSVLVFNIYIKMPLVSLFFLKMSFTGTDIAYTGKKIPPVRNVGFNESGQEVPMVPMRQSYKLFLNFLFIFYTVNLPH